MSDDGSSEALATIMLLWVANIIVLVAAWVIQKQPKDGFIGSLGCFIAVSFPFGPGMILPFVWMWLIKEAIKDRRG